MVSILSDLIAYSEILAIKAIKIIAFKINRLEVFMFRIKPYHHHFKSPEILLVIKSLEIEPI